MAATDPNADIARRTASGSLYSIGASAVTLVLGFTRATLLLRLLLPEHFGVTTLALFYLNLATQMFGFGYDNALIHRKDADDAVRGVYYTLRLGAIVLSVALLAAMLPVLRFFYPDEPLLLPVLLAYMGVLFLRGFNLTQGTILSKRLAFRELAISDVVSSAVMTVVAPTMAWLGYGAWAIVGEQLSGAIARFVMVNIIFRAWTPRLVWDRQIAGWFFSFGRKVWVSSTLVFLLDRFDDWFIGTFLGTVPLGFYSPAYEYARYPRRAIANPILSVFFPVFAQLQDDRLRLSRAFFRATSLMVRLGGLFSLLFVFTAPEFIPWLLGEKWLPMVTTFQLMIVYTFLDPLSLAANNLLTATGRPEAVMRARIVQMVVFIPAVFLLGNWLGIEGVALAADLMVLTGAALLFWQTRRVADYSSRALWLWPAVAMALTGLLVLLADPLWRPLPAVGRMLLKGALIPLPYLAVLWLMEREQLRAGRDMIWGMIRPMLKRRR